MTMQLNATHREIAIRFIRASRQSGARAGDALGAKYLPPEGVSMPGVIADFPAALSYAEEQGWVTKSLTGDYLLTDVGFSAAIGG